ncbi:hypothetical protein GGS23DRAFT_566597 [Durotheca rogersii]|uniref:uncharacterized protein n=1 Tax=Durotheca rogersii TaxID=419775 RepID=UPI00221FBC72|nr:uncharacterized protein GGS23DRAFT_566597 [Durotheca rogersii]KAI5863370.1 hypothetical protein GGS23DRAFT_566597 [Durotheca rogersii]
MKFVLTNNTLASRPHIPNVYLPTVSELLDLCGKEHSRGSITLPSESPVLWVKYGFAIYWNEVVAQATAYHELRRLGSSVRAPAVFYTFKSLWLQCIHRYGVHPRK